MIRPTLRQLEYLIALQDEKSFSNAAEICNVTQSTLSAGIKELETILDQNLVIRGRKNVNLTAFGVETAYHARQILCEVDKITARALAIKSPLTGPLRMGVIPTIAPYFLPQILPSLQKKFPALELQLYEDLSERIVKKLQQGALDLLLMAFPFETLGMRQMPLFEEDFYLACPKGQEPHKNEISTKDLDAENLLLLDDGHCLRDHAIAACNLQLPLTRKAYSATSLQTLVQMVNSGYGMTLLPAMATQPQNLPQNVSVLAFKDPKPTRIIGLAWRSGHPRRDEFETLGRVMFDRYNNCNFVGLKHHKLIG